MQKTAVIISYLLHPLLMPLYCMALIFYNPNYLSFAVRPGLQWLIYIIVFVTTWLMPSLSALFLLYRGEIKSLQMQTQRERTMPLFITACYYSMCYYLLQKLSLPSLISGIILGAAIAIVLTLFINFKWKISIHMVGIGGIVGVLIVLTQTIFANYTVIIILLFFLAGLLGSVRMLAGSHTTFQVYAGFLLGAIVENAVLHFIAR